MNGIRKYREIQCSQESFSRHNCTTLNTAILPATTIDCPLSMPLIPEQSCNKKQIDNTPATMLMAFVQKMTTMPMKT